MQVSLVRSLSLSLAQCPSSVIQTEHRRERLCRGSRRGREVDEGDSHVVGGLNSREVEACTRAHCEGKAPPCASSVQFYCFVLHQQGALWVFERSQRPALQLHLNQDLNLDESDSRKSCMELIAVLKPTVSSKNNETVFS